MHPGSTSATWHGGDGAIRGDAGETSWTPASTPGLRGILYADVESPGGETSVTDIPVFGSVWGPKWSKNALGDVKNPIGHYYTNWYGTCTKRRAGQARLVKGLGVQARLEVKKEVEVEQ